MANEVKIYVASSWRNPRQPEVVEVLRAAGHEVYDFRNPAPGNNGFHWREIDLAWQTWTPARFRRALLHPLVIDGFSRDKDALDWADAVVLVMPCGRSAHLELGYARGKGKMTAILLSDGEPELMYKLADVLLTSDDELLAWAREVVTKGPCHGK